jgi:hypothetical protein
MTKKVKLFATKVCITIYKDIADNKIGYISKRKVIER